MNYKSFISLALLFAFGSITGLKYQVKSLPFPPLLTSQHSQKLIEERTLIHHNALAEIKKEFNITDDTWKSYMDHIYAVAQNDDLFDTSVMVMQADANHWLIKEARKVLVECGVNLGRIEIKLDTDQKINGAAMQWYDAGFSRINHSLILNPDWFAPLSHADREAVLRHEIMHLANYDGIEENYICGLLGSLGYTKQQIDDSASMINYRQQRESRADILSVVDMPVLAQANQDRYIRNAEYTQALPAHFWKTHPSYKTRAENMAKLLAYINRPATLA